MQTSNPLLRRLDLDKCREWVRGVPFELEPELDPHARARMALNRAFVRALDDRSFVSSRGSLCLAGDIELRPDLHLFEAHLRSEDVRGADVQLVVELSAPSEHRDLKVKTPIYAEHGVRELWVIDLEAKTGLVFDKIESGAYAPGRAMGLNDVLTPKLVSGVSLRIADLF